MITNNCIRIKRIQAVIVLVFCGFMLSFTSCIHVQPAVYLRAATPVTLIALRDSDTSLETSSNLSFAPKMGTHITGNSRVGNLPKAVSFAMSKALKTRHLKAVRLAGGEQSGWQDLFGNVSDSQRRLAWLIDQFVELGPVILVETTVDYYALLNGLHKWQVFLKLSVAATIDGTVQQLTKEVPIAVFLPHAHQQENAALSAAAPDIATRLGELLDQLYRGSSLVQQDPKKKE